jgi:hypothetical protein
MKAGATAGLCLLCGAAGCKKTLQSFNHAGPDAPRSARTRAQDEAKTPDKRQLLDIHVPSSQSRHNVTDFPPPRPPPAVAAARPSANAMALQQIQPGTNQRHLL